LPTQTEDSLISKELQRNSEIRDKEVRLIGINGEQLGIMSAYQAQLLANDLELDLVKISPTAVPPVCKIMDYGKHRYEQIKKQKEAKKHQVTHELKEIRLSMTIEDGDVNVKAKHASKFIKEGHKVKVTLRMRGRQNAFQSRAVDVVKSFYEILKDISIIEKQPGTEGRSVIMIIAPTPVTGKKPETPKT